MKTFLLSVGLLLLTSCASQKPQPKYMEEKNQAKFATSHDFAEEPQKVIRAARAVLDALTKESVPAATEIVRDDGNTLMTGWVYAPASKDKYVRYDFNGSPRRKNLQVRRVYQYTVTPGLSGSQVLMNIKEEIEEVNLKTGEHEGWKKVEPEQAAFDLFLKRLREQIRAE